MFEASLLISVAVPAFNASSYIRAALQSVAQQTEQRYEIIVVDDCSIDGTCEIVTDIADCDSRIRLIRLPKNVGPGAARNVAIAAANGTWIALLDADDRYHPCRLKHLLNFAMRTHADIVSDNILLCPDNETELAHIMYSTDQIPNEIRLTSTNFVNQNINNFNTKRQSFGFMQPIIRREFLLKNKIIYNVDTRFGEDFMFYIQCLLAGANWWITPEPFYFYTVRRSSLTESVALNDLRVISAMEQLLIDSPLASYEALFLQSIRRHKNAIDYWRCTTEFKIALQQADFGHAIHVLFEDRFSFLAILKNVAVNTFLKPFVPWIKQRLLPIFKNVTK